MADDLQDWPTPFKRNAAIVTLAHAIFRARGDLLDYPIGADQICSIGKRYPNEVVTLRHCQFPHMVIFDAAVYREAKACAASGARVRLTIEGSKDGRTKILTKVERV